MARILVLDSGPLATACDDRSKPETVEFKQWRIHAAVNGAIIVIPEIADYEVRRELFRAGKNKSLEMLDALPHDLNHLYLALSTEAIRLAARLWADVRNIGEPTADDKALDADVILAAQAIQFVGKTDELIVVSNNYKHIRRYVESRPRIDITP